MTTSLTDISADLQAEIDRARSVVYQIAPPTPLQILTLPNGQAVHVKREDRAPIYSYKWRGAFNKLHALVAEGNQGPFVATSAGNHAQGVALAARRLLVDATIFMPDSTPRLKQQSVRALGGPHVHVRMRGDSFDDAAAVAARFVSRHQATVIEAFDDLLVIAGQATVGLEIMQDLPAVQVVFAPIGGGGLASGVAVACRRNNPHIKVIGVEVEGQDCMRRSIAAHHRVILDSTSTFCDGTAVKQPGRLTFELCRRHLHDIVTVSERQVGQAVQFAWESDRFIPEPSGAIGLAAALQFQEAARETTMATMITGANADFLKIPQMVTAARQRSQALFPV